MEPVLSPEIHVNYLSECNHNFYLQCKTVVSAKKYVLHLVDVVSGISNAIKRSGVDKVVYENLLAKKNWKPELLYLLSCSKLIDINNYFCGIEDDKLFCDDLSQDLVFLFSNRPRDTFYNEVKTELATSILKYAADPENEKYFLQCFANHFYGTICELEEGKNVLLFMSSLPEQTSDSGQFFRLVLSNAFTDNGSSLMETLRSGSYMKPNVFKNLSLLYDQICSKSKNTSEILRKFIFQYNIETKINWSNIGQFLSVIIKRSKYGEIKKLINELIDNSLENSDPYLLYSSLILGRICSLETKTVSYMQWFSSTFSAESTRPLNTDGKAKFFLKCLTDIVYYEEVDHLRAHVNKVPFVPSTCQGDLSEYLQIAKSCLVSMNESIEVGFFEAVPGVKTVDNDVKCLMDGFVKRKKIPPAFLASLQFRRQYFDRELLPKLLSVCPGPNSTHHNVIKELHSLGKISSAAFAKHKEECRL